MIRDKIENTDFLPDQFDRYNFCAVCEKDFASRSSYREHLQNVHKMKLLPFRKKSVRFPTTLKPDPHNSHFYCRVCARKCSTRSTYRIYLFYVRNIVLEPLKGPNRVNPNIQPDEDDSNNYCASCEIKFCHNYRYRKRLQKIHKMTLKPRETVMKARRSIDIICTKRKRLQSNVNLIQTIQTSIVNHVTLLTPIKVDSINILDPSIKRPFCPLVLVFSPCFSTSSSRL